MKFTKPPLSIDDQIALLGRRGMAIPDPDRARRYLAHINYYRLRGYWVRFEERAEEVGDHRFRVGTTFEDVLSIYLFDRYLRLLLMDLIERVEVSVRTQWAYAIAMRHGPHGYLDPGLFNNKELHTESLASLDDELARSREPFVEHYTAKYTDPAMPPVWAVCEIMTLGQLSTWLSNLQLRGDREAVARIYGLDELILCSFLRHLSHVRNLCAHHNRIWNRRFTLTSKLPKYPRRLAEQFNPRADRLIYNTLVLLAYLMTKVSPESDWRRHLIDLIDSHPKAEPAAMGFPPKWREMELLRPSSE